MFKQVKDFIVSKKTQVQAMGTLVALELMTNPVVSADGGKSKMVDLISKLLPVLAVIGIPIALMGAFKLIMAFRNDQGDAVPAAARDLAIGIFLTVSGAVLGPILSSL